MGPPAVHLGGLPLRAVHGSKARLQGFEGDAVVQQGLPEQPLRLERHAVCADAGTEVAGRRERRRKAQASRKMEGEKNAASKA